MRFHLPAAFLALALTLCAACVCGAPESVDNAALIPKILDDAQVALEPSEGGATQSPAWLKSLMIVEVCVETASTDGTLDGMGATLDHLAEMGVNGLWLTPINAGRHYGNYGPHTLNETLTGESDGDKGWAKVAAFVAEAHKRNIRVFFDVVTWGLHKDAPLHNEKPEWFKELHPKYRGWILNWENAELNEWYAARLVDFIMKTGADGFRCDCAPNYAGYEVYRVARERLLKLGRKVAMISEHGSARKGVFDFDQLAFTDEGETWKVGDVFLRKNIVDVVKSGKGLGMRDAKGVEGAKRLYAFCLSCHDDKSYNVKGSPIIIGYQALFSPFIPIWYLGEEWRNVHTSPPHWLYATRIDWSGLERERELYETIKKMIRVRRQFPEIFECFPENHRNSNIRKASVGRPDCLQPYVRYKDGKAIAIVANNGWGDDVFDLSVPFDELGFDAKREYVATDLMRGRELARGTSAELKSFKVGIPKGRLGVILLAPRE